MFTSFRVKLLASLAALVSTLASLACWLWEQCSCALPEAAYSCPTQGTYSSGPKEAPDIHPDAENRQSRSRDASGPQAAGP